MKKYKKPLDGCSLIVWTERGFNGRNPINVLNCDASIFIGGGAGTLEEFCIAVHKAQVIGVLTNSGGVCRLIPEIYSGFRNTHKSELIIGTEPKQLVDKARSVWTDRSSA